MKRTLEPLCLTLLFLGSPLTVATPARGDIVTVSPGESDRPAAIEGTCPTFSWSAVAGAESYEIVVYAFSEEKLTVSGEPVLSRALPGGALSWTPAGACLEAGRSYAWVVRAGGPELDTGWSEERLFRTAAGLSPQDASRALDVLKTYLSAGGSLEELEGHEPTAQASAVWPEGAAESVSLPQPPAAEPDDEDESQERNEPDPIGRAAIPPTELGVSTEIFAPGGAAVRGLNTIDDSIGYLGLAMPATSGGDFDGFPTLKPLDSDEIGVLGAVTNSSFDNYGVVGLAHFGATAGRFLNVNSGGNVRNEVLLGTQNHALVALGDVQITGSMQITGSTSCPLGTFALGAWCIGQEQSARNFVDARTNCWNQGKRLCPLEAILACDVLSPGGADCTLATDSSTRKWIWCAELEDDSNDDRNAFNVSGVLKEARVFAQAGNDATNEIDWHTYDEIYVSYCCTAR